MKRIIIMLVAFMSIGGIFGFFCNRYIQNNSTVQGKIFSNGDYIYYMNNNNRICSINIYTKKTNCLKKSFDHYNITGVRDGLICLRANSEIKFRNIEPCVLLVDIEGNIKYRYNINSTYADFYKDSIYFFNADDDNRLYKIELENNNITKLCDSQGQILRIYNDKIYFNNKQDGNYLYSVDINGANERIISDNFNSYAFDLDSNNLYVQDYNEKRLYRVDLDTGEKNISVDSKIGVFTVIQDNVYYTKYDGNTDCFKIMVQDKYGNLSEFKR